MSYLKVIYFPKAHFIFQDSDSLIEESFISIEKRIYKEGLEEYEWFMNNLIFLFEIVIWL